MKGQATMSILLNFLNQVVKYPKLTLLLIAALTVFFGASVMKIQFSGSVDSFLIKGDPEREFYEQVKSVFGSDGVTVVALTSTVPVTPIPVTALMAILPAVMSAATSAPTSLMAPAEVMVIVPLAEMKFIHKSFINTFEMT
jgi:predicted RND superfamily exporter protein